MKVEFYTNRTDEREEHRWRVVADNNEIVGASSEGFSSAQNALKNFTLLTGRQIEDGGLRLASSDQILRLAVLNTGGAFFHDDDWEVSGL